MSTPSLRVPLHVWAILALVLATMTGSTGVALAAPGDLDPSFDGDGRKTISGFDSGADVAVQTDGKIVLTGLGGANQFAVTRLNPDGSFDASFGGDGGIEILFSGASYAVPQAIALQADGRIVVAGFMNGGDSLGFDMAVARVNPDGSPDTSFSEDGQWTSGYGQEDTASGLAVQSDGKILLAGTRSVATEDIADFAAVRLTSTGSLDTSFDGDGIVEVDFGNFENATAAALQSDGKIVLVGSTRCCRSFAPDGDIAVARVTAGGALDPSFDADGLKTLAIGAIDFADAVVLQGDGRIVIGGGVRPPPATGGRSYAVVARLTPAGVADASFDGDGIRTIDFEPSCCSRDLALEPSGRIVIAIVVGGGPSPDFVVTRLNSTGSDDTSFSGDGRQKIDFYDYLGGAEGAQAVALQPDGRIVVTGTTLGDAGFQMAIARLDGDPVPQRGDYKNAAKFCKAERAFLGKQAFREKYATKNGARAFRKCVRRNR